MQSWKIPIFEADLKSDLDVERKAITDHVTSEVDAVQTVVNEIVVDSREPGN